MILPPRPVWLWPGVLALALSIVCTPREARAQVDMTGPWFVFILVGPNVLECPIDFVQTGTSLAITGSCPVGPLGMVNANGTIDPMTGQFDAAGTGGGSCPTLTLTIGDASIDGTQFFASFACTGGPASTQGSLVGFRCGNGIVDAGIGEQCDDGNHNSNDCCTTTCQYDALGSVCAGDGNPCTNDVCDGAGTCMHEVRTGPCSDGNQCSTGDTCTAGVCVGTTLPDGTVCDDANQCTSETCQGGVCAAVNLPDASPCDDNHLCTAGETCNAGACLGDDVVCPACMRCHHFLGGCVVEVFGYLCDAGAQDAILLKNSDPDVGHWRWVSSVPLTPADFGNPLTTTSYEFCVVDPGSTTIQNRLILSAAVPAGGGWKQTKSGFRFKSPDKKLKVRLKAGAAGKSKVVVSAKGSAYNVENLPPPQPVEVYLRTAEGVLPPVCLKGIYAAPIKSTATTYRAANPHP